MQRSATKELVSALAASAAAVLFSLPSSAGALH